MVVKWGAPPRQPVCRILGSSGMQIVAARRCVDRTLVVRGRTGILETREIRAVTA